MRAALDGRRPRATRSALPDSSVINGRCPATDASAGFRSLSSSATSRRTQRSVNLPMGSSPRSHFEIFGFVRTEMAGELLAAGLDVLTQESQLLAGHPGWVLRRSARGL